MADSFPLILRQLRPPFAEVVLRGPSKPEGELAEKLGLSFVKRYYPGNDEASVQVLNMTTGPITLKGLLSDRETGVAGFAAEASQVLRAMGNAKLPVRMIYGDLLYDCLLAHVKLGLPSKSFEVRYEFVLEPYSTMGGQPVEADAFARVSGASVRAALTELEEVTEALPEEVRLPPAGVFLTPEELAEPETIPPIAFELDPWLEYRIDAEEAVAKVRLLLEVLGNESALNISDGAIAVAREAYILTSRAKGALDEWDSEGVDLISAMTRTENVYAAIAAYEGLQLALEGA